MKLKTILITGCSSGIGHDAAVSLTKQGHQVIASCRKEADVAALIAQGIDAVQLDVNDRHSIKAGFSEALDKLGGRLDVLINNAGYGQSGALEDIPYDALLDQFTTNVFGLMAVTQLAIPVMRQQAQGRIINLSSILGVISLPFRGAYNASKYAVEGLSDTLRLELKPSGIKVITIEPGPIESRFRDNSIDYSLKKIDVEHSHFKANYQYMMGEFRDKKADSIFTRKTDAVIAKLIHAIESNNPKAKYPVTFPAHLFVALKRILPVKAFDRVLSYISAKELTK